eukprot:Hpha_TRINITY_DN15690_c1_g1::TRINITY_DN15690_c1_g1_i2::g.100802::m.100802
MTRRGERERGGGGGERGDERSEDRAEVGRGGGRGYHGNDNHYFHFQGGKRALRLSALPNYTKHWVVAPRTKACNEPAQRVPSPTPVLNPIFARTGVLTFV